VCSLTVLQVRTIPLNIRFIRCIYWFSDAKSEGSGISMGSDFEILDELNAG